MNKGDKVWHSLRERAGVVHSLPRAGSEKVLLLLDGNASPQYYLQADIQVMGEDGKPGRPLAEKPEPGLGVGLPKLADAPAPSGPVDSYPGELTLDRLLVLQADLRRRMETLDEAVMQVRVYAMIRKSLEGIKYSGEVDLRCQASVQALKIKQDTQRAQEAANRLAARGAL